MADLVRNALRRKLATAEAAGDSDRIERLRRLIPGPPVVETNTTTSTTTPSLKMVAWWPESPEPEDDGTSWP